MSIAEIATECSCDSIGRSDLRQCPIHFRLWNGDRRLPSVRSIIDTCWPREACTQCGAIGYKHKSDCIIGQKIENARDRGVELDRLAADYVRGTLTTIPRGTREDARDLFLKFQRWFDKQNFKTVEAQVVLGREDYGGVLDFRLDGIPVELKGTYEISDTHKLQTAAYGCLAGHEPFVASVLHITERYPEPRLVSLAERDFDDWRIMLAHFRMVTRRTGATSQT